MTFEMSCVNIVLTTILYLIFFYLLLALLDGKINIFYFTPVYVLFVLTQGAIHYNVNLIMDALFCKRN